MRGKDLVRLATEQQRVRSRHLLDDDLAHHVVPIKTVPVLPPPPLSALGTRRESLPVSVHLGLVLARNGEGDGFVELEVRSAVQAAELPAHQGEVDGQDVSPLPAREVRGRFDHLVDVRVGEQRYVESRGLLCLAVEPEARDYAFHGGLDLAWRSLRFLRHVGSSPVSLRAANRRSPIEFVFESIESASVSSETISRHLGAKGLAGHRFAIAEDRSFRTPYLVPLR